MAERSTGIVPVHRYIITSLVEKISDELDREVLLTYQDDENYDAFKLSDGQRQGAWCTLRPTNFNPSSPSGRGLATATRPNVFSSEFGTRQALHRTHEPLGMYVRVDDAAKVEPGTYAVEKDAQGLLTLVFNTEDSLPAANDSLVFRSGGKEAVLKVSYRDHRLEPHAAFAVDEDDGEGTAKLADLGFSVEVFVRKAQTIRVSLVGADVDFTLRYATTSTDEYIDFLAKWVFIREKNRFNFAVRYLGLAMPITTTLEGGVAIPPKDPPGESASYQIFEGSLTTSMFFGHDDVRDTAIETSVVDLDLLMGVGTDDADKAQYKRTVRVA